MPKRLAASVANMQNKYDTVFDCEQNPINVGWVAVEQVAHFERKDCALRG